MKKILAIIFCLFRITTYSQSISWNSSIDIAPASNGNLHPRIVTDAGGNPLVIWGKLSTNECKFSRWNGSAFTSPVAINPSSMPAFTQTWAGPDIASKGDTIYVVFKETPEDVNNIYIVHSFDGGINFSSPVQVDFIAPFLSRFPTVTVDETGNPIVAFMKFNLGFSMARWVVTRSTDYGNAFSQDILASGWAGSIVCDCCPGALVSSGSTVAMLYRNNFNSIRDSWCGISYDSAASFSGGTDIDQNNWQLIACPSTGPDGIIIGDSLYSVFMNGANGSRVYFSATSLSGIQSPGSVQLSSSASNYPRIAHSGNSFAIVWKQSDTGNDEVALKFTDNIANGLSAAVDTIAFSGVENADVAMYNGNIYVVWEDNNSGTVKFQKGTYSTITSLTEVNVSKENLIMYPNPACNGLINVAAHKLAAKNYVLLDITGRILFSGDCIPGRDFTIDISSLSHGSYFLELMGDKERNVGNLVKM